MLTISDFPNELLTELLTFALASHPISSNILRVNSRFCTIGQLILHTHIRFRHLSQVAEFAGGISPLACPPRSLTVEIPAGTGASSTDAVFSVFRYLIPVLRRCGAQSAETSPTGQLVQLPLNLLELDLNTHVRDLHLRYVYDALSLTNPKVFIWRGSDLEHHFSIAIVPTATSHVLRAAATWTNIQEITLSNVAFPTRDAGLDVPERPLLPVIPSLRRLTLDRATMLSPERVAGMVCLPGQDGLEIVRLIDAYSDSIWGPRIRRSDVEKAIEPRLDRDVCVLRVRQVVRCEAKTERIMGGDRVDAAGGIALME